MLVQLLSMECCNHAPSAPPLVNQDSGDNRAIFAALQEDLDAVHSFTSASSIPLVHQNSGENRAIIAALREELDAAQAAQASLAADRARYEREHEERLCIICMENPKSIKLDPCRHICICPDCSSNTSLRNCPVCRVVITNRERVYGI